MSTTLERFSFPLTGSEEDAARASQSRKKIVQKLGCCCFLNPCQKQDVELAVGEAFANAIGHALLKDDEGECVTCEVAKTDDTFAIEIINPSDEFSTETPSLPEPSEENGRGRLVIGQIVQCLSDSGLEVKCDLDFRPQGDHQGQAIFFLSVRR